MIFLAVAVAGCRVVSPAVRGSGNVISQTRAVGGFDEVTLKGEGQLVIDKNGTESLSITADDDLLPYLTSDVEGKHLILGTKNNVNLSPTKTITYKLSAKDLNAIELSGSGAIDAKGIHSDRLKLVLGGSGDLSIAGTADQQETTIAGSGNYHGENLKSKSVTISIYGSGDASLNASEKLNALIAGSGSVKYTGDATVTQQILGSGSVQKK